MVYFERFAGVSLSSVTAGWRCGRLVGLAGEEKKSLSCTTTKSWRQIWKHMKCFSTFENFWNRLFVPPKKKKKMCCEDQCKMLIGSSSTLISNKMTQSQTFATNTTTRSQLRFCCDVYDTKFCTRAAMFKNSIHFSYVQNTLTKVPTKIRHYINIWRTKEKIVLLINASDLGNRPKQAKNKENRKKKT